MLKMNLEYHTCMCAYVGDFIVHLSETSLHLLPISYKIRVTMSFDDEIIYKLTFLIPIAIFQIFL